MSIAYQKLAENQFLLLDSIPYALNYNGGIRKKEIYQDLIFEYLTSELLRINELLEFDENLKIAFAFKINGYVIINAFSGKIKIGKEIIYLVSDRKPPN